MEKTAGQGPNSSLIPDRARDFCLRADGWARERSPQAQSLWAKSGDGTDFLTLPQHMVDSACRLFLV